MPIKKQKELIQLYKEFSKTGKLTGLGGLCGVLERTKYESEFDELMTPHIDDWDDLSMNNHSIAYWGLDRDVAMTTYQERLFEFTPLRQTLLLLFAATQGEL